MNTPELDFLKRHPNYAFHAISGFYPLTGEQLRKYRNVLFWDEICENEEIEWSVGLVQTFLKYLKDKKGKLNSTLHYNNKLPWSIELIKHFETLWYWDVLGEKAEIQNNELVQRVFKKQLQPVNAWIASNDLKTSPESDKFLKKKYEAKPWLLYTTRQQIERDSKIDWNSLSSSVHFKWTHDFIRDYQDKLDWRTLSCNSSIQWTDEMIFEFQDKIFWGGLEVTVDKLGKKQTCIEPGLTVLSGKCWTQDQIAIYRDKIDWHTLSICERSSQWDSNHLTAFEKYIDIGALSANRKAWVNCFGKLIDSDIDSILGNKELQAKVDFSEKIIEMDEIERSHVEIPKCLTYEYFLKNNWRPKAKDKELES